MKYKLPGKTLEAVRRKHERQANDFAMHLLVPDSLLEKELKKQYDISNDADIKKLADVFKVPIGVIGIRIGQLLASRQNR